MKRTSWKLFLVLGYLTAGWVSSASAGDDAVVKGKILFKGDEKKFVRQTLDTTKDPNCAKSKAKIGSWEFVLNTKTTPITVRNVLVYVKDGVGDRKFEAPKDPVTLDQQGCEYTPHVLALQEGQEILIRNSDDTNHNIHFLPKVNQEINRTQPQKNDQFKVKLDAEAPFHVKCDVHPWMGAYVAVFKHPFFSVAGEDGTYTIKGLSPGKYTIAAWHEKWGEQTATVEVKTGESKDHDFTYEPK